MGGCLYLIPTPIGNMEDITYRAVHILEAVDFLLCEDTRVTDQLLRHFKMSKKLYSCHDHNEEQMITFVLEQLKEGKQIGLVTDRGTPIISDPGYKIAEAISKTEYPVIGLPGPTAFVPALIMSGLSPEPFLFYGFLNAKKGKREQELEAMKRYPYTMIFYEAPHRIADTLLSIEIVLGARKCCLCREISKKYEEVYRGYPQDILPLVPSMKGEMVLVVEGSLVQEDYATLPLLEHIELYKTDGLTEMEAIKIVAKERHLPKSEVYQEYQRKKGSV